MSESRASTSQRGLSGLPLLGLLFGLAVALSAYVRLTVDESRVEAATSVIVEVFLLFSLAGALALRDPEGRLRLSNPALMLLGWMFYYFIKPAVAWLQGDRMALEAPNTVVIDVSVFEQVQYAHCYLTIAIFLAYFLVAPTSVPRAILGGGEGLKIRPLWFLIVGLFPYASNVVERLVTTGSIMASASYGDLTATGAEELMASRSEGGAAYLLTQIMSKVWYLPIMALGVGYFVLLARYIREGRRVAMALFFAQIPVLLFLGNGGRSYTAFPFLIALVLVDALSVPLRWIRALPAAALAVQAFNFYGILRGFQTESPTGAINASLETIENQSRVLNTEDGIMLTKEAYCLLLSQHGHAERGIGYFTDSIILLLPAQIVPSKASIRTTAEFLSDELLGHRRQGAGVAGTTVGDGLLIGGELGVIALGVVLGLILGLMVRWGLAGQSGARLWRCVIMLLMVAQTAQYIRADLVVVLTQLLYYVLIPAIVIEVLLGAKVLDREVWEMKVPLIHRGA